MDEQVGTTPAPYQANILAVDDRQENLDVLLAVLEPLGQNIITADSGDEALRVLLQHDCAVILLDVRMAGMDGFETAAHIKRRERTRHVPIIFLTAQDTDPYHTLRGYSEGAVDYIAKPFDPWMLRSKVSVFVELDIKNHLLRQQTNELARSNVDLVRLAAAAEASSRAKSTFLDLAGHELRTPLAVISGYSSLITAGAFGETGETLQRALDIIADKAMELGGLVDSILAAARLEADSLPTVISKGDLNHLATEAVNRAQPRAVLLTGAVTIGTAPTPIPVQVDPEHIGRILDNLINNALTYGGDHPLVEVTVEAGPQPRVIVEDHGIGMASSDHERIFERFVRGGEAGTAPSGTGLGLSICRDLAERNGALVTLERSELGQGSAFSVVFGMAKARITSPSRTQVAETAGA